MTLDLKIQLVNELIAEDPGTTVLDYLKVVREVREVMISYDINQFKKK